MRGCTYVLLIRERLYLCPFKDIWFSLEIMKYFWFSISVVTEFSEKAICRSSRPAVLCKKGVLKNFVKFTGKHLCRSAFLNTVANLTPATLLKKILRHRFFLVNFTWYFNYPKYFFKRETLYTIWNGSKNSWKVFWMVLFL